MPAPSDFDADLLLKDAFGSFRSTALPPSAHSAAQARRTVHRRRQVRYALAAAAAAVLVAVPVAAIGLAGNRSAAPPPAAPSPSATAPAVTPTTATTTPDRPTESPTPRVAELPRLAPFTMPEAPTLNGRQSIAVSTSTLNTNGSSGPVIGWVNIMIFNHGMAGLGQVDLTFQLSPTVQTNGTAWADCARDDAHNRVTCTRPAPVVGKTAVFGYRFSTDLGGPPPVSLTVEPRGATDVDQSDNTVVLGFCTNGCVWNPPWTDVWITAGKLITNGASGVVSGTVQVTVGNRGPAELDHVGIAFLFSDAVQPSGDNWKSCARNDFASNITCYQPAPPIGGSRTYTFAFTVDLSKPAAGLKLEAFGEQVWESSDADNVADLVVCSTAC